MLSKRHLRAVSAADPTDAVAGSWHVQLTLGHLWDLRGAGTEWAEQGRWCPGISWGLRPSFGGRT